MGKVKRPDPVAGEIYRHFKGNLYEIVTIAVHTESSDRLVVYKSVENPSKVFARPVEMFMSDVDHIRYPLIRAKYRFTLEAACINVGEPNTQEEIIPEEIISEVDINHNVYDTSDTADEHGEVSEIAEVRDTVNTPDTDDTAKYREDGTLVIDPVVEAILDEKEYTKKIENFQLLRGKCTEEMLTTLAISLDIQLTGDTIDDKYAEILKTLRMHEKYESARLRF